MDELKEQIAEELHKAHETASEMLDQKTLNSGDQQHVYAIQKAIEKAEKHLRKLREGTK